MQIGLSAWMYSVSHRIRYLVLCGPESAKPKAQRMREDLRSWGPALGQGAAEDKEGTQA